MESFQQKYNNNKYYNISEKQKQYLTLFTVLNLELSLVVGVSKNYLKGVRGKENVKNRWSKAYTNNIQLHNNLKNSKLKKNLKFEKNLQNIRNNRQH